MTLAPGIHADIAPELYHGAEVTDEPSFSASIAKVILQQSPLHAWFKHPKLNPNYEPTHSDKFDLGTVVHSLFLEGDKFAEKTALIDAKDWRTKAAQEHREAARAAGLVPLLMDDWQRVVQMVEAIHYHIGARTDDPPLFDAGKPEATIVWREHDVLCKARLDWLRDDLAAIDDMKSTGASASPFDWGRRTFWSIGADVQARFYQRGVKALTGETPAFRFLVAETTAPFCLSVIDLAESAVELADQKIDKALEIWKRCLDSGVWPGYPSGVASVEVGWQAADFVERHWQDDSEIAA